MVEAAQANQQNLAVPGQQQHTETTRASSKVKKDTGVFWDEPLDLYLEGTININLYNNVLGFNAGETISGTVDIEIGKPFDATDLVIEFKGVERSHMSADQVITVKDYHREVKEVTSMKQIVVQFPEGQSIQPGQYSYPFQIFTPSWLPESSLFKTRKDRFTVEYTLRAQFTPRDPEQYVDHPTMPGKYWNVSLFRGSRRVNIYQPYQDIPLKNYKLMIKSSVGLRLFGSTESKCEVRFVKNQYYPGEMVDIWLDCDNSKCDKNVKSYKFKLHRQLRCREATSGHYDTFVTNLKTVKEKGCGAGKKETKHFQFQIPSMEKDCSEEATTLVDRTSKAIMNKDMRIPGMKSLHKGDDSSDPEPENYTDLCPSWMGQVFQVQYILKVYLKHDGFFERGQGQCVNLPLRVMATPRVEPSTEPWRIPAAWNPYQGTEEPTYVYLQNPDEKPEYMTKFIDRNWAKWEANLEPVLAAAKEEEQSKTRRMTVKMNADDPDEEVKNDGPFSPAQDQTSHAEAMFAHLPPNQPPAYASAQQPHPMLNQQSQQVPQAQQPVQEPSFYDQFMKGKVTDESAASAQQQEQQPAAEATNYANQEQPQIYYDENGNQIYYDQDGNPQYYDPNAQQYDYGQETNTNQGYY